ncbi:hypothetical protein F0L74_14475 [Chitinophaga agrisoli]|uniref:Uncharacterized protein n=1 Tax=Chitinophaga agrisoli TaxID=2607653 RepID=A0A5B2VWJ0_9BACT|nr:hypothetical protein [Chitinophaga agrisoli]KAA2243681.1 hypothetical protein F0L74_14475 [Chitinophaga agrisoli]
MKKLLSLSAVACLLMVACSKDSIGTKPVLTFKSYSQPVVDLTNSESGLQAFFQIQDGDGDIENGFWVQTFFDSVTDSLNFERKQMPNIDAHVGGKVDAEVILTLDNISLSPPNNTVPDSIHFRIYVEDNAGNKSDTITTPKVALLKQ